MDLSPNSQFTDAARKDGWTAERKAHFLALLAETGNVRLSARRCGLSAQSAYLQRRRDPLFARGWAGALPLAREQAEQMLADRAMEGVEEEVWYRGELVGTRRKFDSRLLLAHLARLDRQVEKQAGAGDSAENAERFDEIVARVAGTPVPETLAIAPDGLPYAPDVQAERATEAAERRIGETAADSDDEVDWDAFDDAVIAAGTTARAAARSEWDGWMAAVCEAVDRLAGIALQDSVNVSTSPCAPAQAEASGEPGPAVLPPEVPACAATRPAAEEQLAVARTGIVAALAARGRA